MDLSIVIPAYNEAAKIRSDIKAAAAFLKKHQISGEIIIVDDGSTDGTAKTAKNTTVLPGVKLLVLQLKNHTGKGNAIRSGIQASSGNLVMFADSGLCVPYSEALKGISLIRNSECDIAHGSRKLPESDIVLPQPWHRRFFSTLFRLLLIAFMKIPVRFSDTQCGFKIYDGEVGRSLYGDSFTNGFMLDVEIILRVLNSGYRIEEFPIQWRCDRDSRLSVTRSPWRIFAESVSYTHLTLPTMCVV